METKIQEIQPTGADQWLRQDAALKEASLIPPVTKAEKRGEAKVSTQDKQGRASESPGMEKGKAKELVEEVQSYLEDLNIQLSFDLSEKTGEVVVRVIDRDTGDVIRQVPPENLLDLREKLKELRGVLFDGTV